MTSIPADALRVLESVPDSIPALGPALNGLTLSGPADASAFLVEGHRAAATGTTRRGVSSITIDESIALWALDAHCGDAANIVQHPGIAQRELMGPKGSTIETIVVAPMLPFVVVQWGEAGRAAPERVEFELRVEPPVGDVQQTPMGISVPLPDGRVRSVGVSGGNCTIEVAGPVEDRLHVVIRPRGDGPLSLIVSSGRPTEVRSALSASLHLQGHATRAAQGALEGGLSLVTGISELDEGVAWARTRLHGLITSGPPQVPSAPHSEASGHDTLPVEFLAGLAATSTGDRETARRALVSPRLRESAAGALLAAHFAATFSDASHARTYANHWLAGKPSSDRALGAGQEADALVYKRLADALHHAAPEAIIVELRRRASAVSLGKNNPRAQAAEAPSSGARRLPMISPKVEADSWPSWLRTLLDGEPQPPHPGSIRHDITVMRQLGALFLTDPETAWTGWRGALSHGLTDGPAGPGTWDPSTSNGKDREECLTAELLLALAHGLLGVRADAPSGRLHLAPRLPSHLTAFSARGIVLGDSAIGMNYERSKGTHHFTLEPEMASVPPVVVFEPAVRGHVVEVRVDGEVAELELRREGNLTIAPVQVPIDGVRHLEISTTD